MQSARNAQQPLKSGCNSRSRCARPFQTVLSTEAVPQRLGLLFSLHAEVLRSFRHPGAINFLREVEFPARAGEDPTAHEAGV